MTERSRWGYAGLDDGEYDTFVRSPPSSAPAERRPLPRDPETSTQQPLVVQVDEVGRASSVTVSPDWRERIAPHALGAHLLQQLRTATARALLTAATNPTVASSAPAPVDLGPWAGNLDRVSDEARQDALRLREAIRQHHGTSTTVRSTHGRAWGLVRGSAIADIGVDQHWAGSAHRLDLQAELLDVAQRLHAAAAPDRLTQGPVSSAAHAVTQLSRDPIALARAAGLIP